MSADRGKAKRVKRAITKAVPDMLLEDIRRLIEESRRAVAVTINAALSSLYWRIGKRINEEILRGERAEYGQQIVHALSTQLHAEYGRGFTARNLFNMIRFAEVFPEEQIVAALVRQLSWTHFRTVIYIDDPLKRDFYAEMCRVERWSTRTLHKKIDSMLYERTAISKKPEELIKQELARLRDANRMSPDLVFRDSLCPRFSEPERHLQRKGSGSRHPARTGKLSPGTRRWLHLC